MTDHDWGLEPRARFDLKFDNPPTLHEIALSNAISQKRIADALEAIAAYAAPRFSVQAWGSHESEGVPKT